MSRLIRITEETIQEIQNDFIESLRKMKMSGGKISYTKEFGKIERKADLIFTEKAWLKQEALVREFSSEVGWHGIARRGDNPDKDEYYIDDIMVYPQEVTGVTVTTDQEEYQNWLMSQDDETFNNIRMQGHSHVNMGTTPSGVDESLYERILDQLTEDMFYIFLIWNKRGDRTIKIYDLRENVLFETLDVDVYVEGGYNIDEFLTAAKESVKKKTYSTPYGGRYINGVYQGNIPKAGSAADSDKHGVLDKTTSEKKGKKKGKVKNAERTIDSYMDDFYDDDYYYRKFGMTK